MGRLPWVINQTSSCNMTRHIPSYQDWMRQQSRKKGSSKVLKRVIDSCSSHCEVLDKNTKLQNHPTFAEDIGLTHAGSLIVSSVSVKLCESWLVDSVDYFLVVSLTPLAPTVFLAFFPRILWALLMFGSGSLHLLTSGAR